uniref:LsmAD domain-containing protein n=1 Tax=Arundo donax TaxID=35708 RepID=A0A0A8Y0T2_ARUDO
MMSHQQQMAASRPSVNGLPHRKLDREGSGRHESKTHLVNSSSGGFTSAENGGKLGNAGHSRDRLIYVLTQLIGHHVDVHVKNGSVITGIFHATNSDKDFGVVLKMALVIKDGSVKGQRYAVDFVKKPETMIISARELVQILAKDVALGGDELPKGPGHDKRKDLLIDSAISRTHYPEERELERWAPDEGDSECLELEKYDRKGHRSWDQFETNAALFGVKSTFNEEVYTTKLERGPHMRELEKHASRIAREIEGEDTKDVHLAEERGLYMGDDLDHDEEIKYSAVRRDNDNNKYKSFTKVTSSTHHADSLLRTGNIDPKDLLACSSTMDEESSSYILVEADPSAAIQTNNVSQLTSDFNSNKPLSTDESRLDKKLSKDSIDDMDNRDLQSDNTLPEGIRPLISEDLDGPPSSSHAYEPSSSAQGFKSSDGSAVEPVKSSQRPGSSTSSTSERIAANSVASAPGLSPSSSLGSLTSEKSTLNPNAKEFKLNPNAKSFTPSVSVRPPTPPASDGSYYYPNNMPTAPLGPGLPVGMGFPPAYGGQPIMYNAQPGTSPQGYMHPAGPQVRKFYLE